eukprot:753828-Hanusia_phi.AAC.4
MLKIKSRRQSSQDEVLMEIRIKLITTTQSFLPMSKTIGRLISYVVGHHTSTSSKVCKSITSCVCASWACSMSDLPTNEVSTTFEQDFKISTLQPLVTSRSLSTSHFRA